jgi:hypothetical protein
MAAEATDRPTSAKASAQLRASLVRARLVNRRLRNGIRYLIRPETPPPAEEPVADEQPASSGIPSEFFHNTAHELRTLALEDVPKGARRVLSAGAAGRWYFDWFERSVGPVDIHVGIEAFEPRPPDLPEYVRWIESTVDRFEGVEDASIDLVYAGQTTEHLWAPELMGFLTESRRVLVPGGLLVMDSPNRLVTEHLYWSHGGHTIELAIGEMEGLLTLAGFDVETRRGLWRCRFGADVLALEAGIHDPATLVRRAAYGATAPDDAFVWWLEARRSTRPADSAALAERIAELFGRHWPTRVARGMWPGPSTDRLRIEPTPGPVFVSTLPFPLHQGRWRLELTTVGGQWKRLRAPRVDLVGGGGQLMQSFTAENATSVRDRSLVWEFDHPYLVFALQLRMVAEGADAAVEFAMPFDLRPVDS